MLSSHEKADRILQDATSALVSLGFKPQEASRLISLVQTDCHSAEDIIRLALQSTIKGSKYDNNGSTDKRSLPE